jgi:hypothetical protein
MEQNQREPHDWAGENEPCGDPAHRRAKLAAGTTPSDERLAMILELGSGQGSPELETGKRRRVVGGVFCLG